MEAPFAGADSAGRGPGTGCSDPRDRSAKRYPCRSSEARIVRSERDPGPYALTDSAYLGHLAPAGGWLPDDYPWPRRREWSRVHSLHSDHISHIGLSGTTRPGARRPARTVDRRARARRRGRPAGLGRSRPRRPDRRQAGGGECAPGRDRHQRRQARRAVRAIQRCAVPLRAGAGGGGRRPAEARRDRGPGRAAQRAGQAAGRGLVPRRRAGRSHQPRRLERVEADLKLEVLEVGRPARHRPGEAAAQRRARAARPEGRRRAGPGRRPGRAGADRHGPGRC